MSLAAPPAATGTVSDGALVERVRAGDPRAYQELYARHERRVAGVCRRRLTEAADVSDAVQETFARALARLDDLREPERFGAWTRAIAARVAVDHLRGRGRSWPLDRVPDVVDVSATPDELAEATADQARVRLALAGLGERDRTALWLRHGTEAPVAEVARELGVTEGSARVLLTRARQRLRAAVAELPALVPLPLLVRRPRGTLAARLSALDPSSVLVPLATAAAVALGPAVVPEPDLPGSAPVVVQTTAPSPAPDVGTRVDPAEDAEPVTPAPTAAAPGDGRAASPAAPEGAAQGRPVAHVAETVHVQHGYPDDEPPAAEVRVVSAGDDAATWRFYGPVVDDPAGVVEDPVGTVTDAVGGAVEGLLGR